MDIKRKAISIYKKHRTNCPFKLAKILGVIILYWDLPDNVKGYSRRVLRKKMIVINNNLDEKESIFVCAHELAHILLHKGVSHYFITHHTYIHIGRFEREAHTFALHLLIAADSLEEDESIYDLLSRNLVPAEMAEYYE